MCVWFLSGCEKPTQAALLENESLPSVYDSGYNRVLCTVFHMGA